MYRAGVRFIARGFVMPELVREISETVDREVLETADPVRRS